MGKDLILIGRFGAPHGVRGHLRLKSFTSEPAAIGSYGPLADASGQRTFAFAELRPVKGDMFIVKLKGVNDRQAAESLTNVELFVARGVLPEPDEDEFYLTDLIGLEAVNTAGEFLGKVNNVLNFGAGDILEISPPQGGETTLYAFTKANVPHIDLKAGRVTLVPPIESEVRENGIKDVRGAEEMPEQAG